jgi:hypothetical protein
MIGLAVSWLETVRVSQARHTAELLRTSPALISWLQISVRRVRADRARHAA